MNIIAQNLIEQKMSQVIDRYYRKRKRWDMITPRKRLRSAFYRPRRRRLHTKYLRRHKRFTVSKPLINRGPSIMPQLYQTKLVYETSYDADTGGGGSNFLTFRGNSIYDPYYAAGGTTVNGWTELETLYGKYRVVGSRATISAIRGNNAHEIAVYLIPTREITAFTAPNARLHPLMNRILIGNNEDGHKVMTSYARTDTMLGLKNVEDDVGTSCAFNTNPAHEWYWNVGVAGTANETVTLRVTIEYYAQLFDLQPVSPGAL